MKKGRNSMASASETKSIARGVSVLSITGIVCKVVGVLYSIPLARILGDTGLGLFQTVFPTYNLLLTLSSAGLPVAVSRMVSHFLARGETGHARRTFHTALALLVTIGCFFSLMMFLSNHLLTRIVGVEEASKGFYAIAPCVALVCALSAFRGFVQGQQNMVPTAISQLIEQVGKVAVSLPLAALGMRSSLADGAAGALLGITIVEFLALVYMMIRAWIHRRDLDEGTVSRTDANGKQETEKYSKKALARQLIRISIPITISACIVPLAQFIDSAMMVKRLMHAGIEQQAATSLYGIFSGMVIRLINIPTALALAISMSLVPAISAAKAVENDEAVRARGDTGIRYAFLIGFPCSIGMSILAKEILSFFYAETLSPARLQTAAELLTVSALTVVLFTVVQATSSILQGLHKQVLPMYTMVAGVACKIVLNYVLIGTPGIDIHGGPVASVVCYSVVMIPNLIFCCREAKMSFNWMGWVVRPLLAAAAMGLVIFLLKHVLPASRISTILEILAGVVIYVSVAMADGALSKEDLRSLGGRRKKQ